MNTESAVEFPTPTRVHVALAVQDAPRATAFYRALLGRAPTKVRAGYAKFEIHDPPLNLALNETPEASAPPMPQHFGIQVQQHAIIDSIASRMRGAGFSGEIEGQVTCCYAVQDKIWFTDPDGHRWELFIVTEADSPVHSRGPEGEAIASCCTPAGTAAPEVGAKPAPSEAVDETQGRPCCEPTCCS